VTQTSALLSSIPNQDLFVDQYVEVGESFSFLQNWTVQMRSMMTKCYMVPFALMNVTGHKSQFFLFLCRKILANGSMKSAELKEHLMSVHHENASKDARFLSHEKKLNLKKWGTSKT
jgi:hypothetical protein